MKFIADLHIHSKYSRATSPQMEPEVLSLWAKKKGIDLIATGDITHPRYLNELKEKLEEDGSGFLILNKGNRCEYANSANAANEDRCEYANNANAANEKRQVKFILSGEIASIYKQGDKCRRIHTLILAPDFKTVEKINGELTKLGCNLKSDGRPIVGVSAKNLAQICFEANEKTMVIPAHIWTPWFSVFGSKSGFDTLEECYEELTPKIFAAETGLSSDPEMNWRLSQLDRITLISNSDAHSPAMIGREANVFEFEKLTYDELYQTLKTQDQKKFLHTIEFYPQEGKYHADGHRACDVNFTPAESLKHKNICPVCKKELVLGVDHRVAELADRELGFKPPNKIPYKNLIPLNEIIGECLRVNKTSKKVKALYEQIVERGGNEFNVLLNLTREEITAIGNSTIAEAITRLRDNKVYRVAGYDGVYGVIKVFAPGELERIIPKQKTLSV
jgi:DNA helicase II / ATP-dependent DNA helicase PcrA